MRHSPQHVVSRMQQHRGIQRLAELGRHRNVVVVAVRAHDRHHMATAYGIHDGACVVRGVEHHDLGVVADEPDVVVDFPTATVEFEHPVGNNTGDVAPSVIHHFITTTERSTSPACILWNASSTSFSPMRSDTNFSNGSLPCR